MSNKQHIVYIVIIGILLLNTCGLNHSIQKGQDSFKAAIEYTQQEKNQLINDVNMHASDIVILKQNLISEKEGKALLGNEIEKYKKVNSYLKGEILTSINDLKINFSDPEKPLSTFNDTCVHIDTVTNHYMRFPRTVLFEDKWIYFSAMVDRGGITIDSMSTINKFDVTIGMKKKQGLFSSLRKSDPVVELKSYSPYSTIPYVNNIVFNQEKTPWYFSRAAFFGYGFLTNTIISKTILK